MSKITQLDKTEHKNLRIQTDRSAQLGDTLMYCQTFAQELRFIQAHYPILFHKVPDKEDIYPIALFGFDQGENLFLSEKGWDARYVPLMVQRQPFYIGLSKAKAENAPEHIINIDLEHPRVNTAEGQLMFDDQGQSTEFLRRVAGMLETIHQWSEFSLGFIAALNREELLEPMNLDITLRDRSKGQLLGFHGIHEEKFKSLSKDTLFEFKEAGYLEPLYMALASVSNVGHLIERKSDRL